MHESKRRRSGKKRKRECGAPAALPVLGQSAAGSDPASPDAPRADAVPLGSRAPKSDEGDPPVVGFVSLGCAKNLVDSETMLGQIAEAGAIITGDEDAADTIVVNTCGFLGAARDEVLEVLDGLVQRKRAGTLKRIVVAGCLVQRDGGKLLEMVPEIDALVGVNNRDDVARAVMGGVGERAGGGGSAGASPSRGGSARQEPRPPAPSAGRMPVPHSSSGTTPHPDLYLGEYHAATAAKWSDQGRLRLTPQHYAYVRISEGCNQKCTFCTIPAIRGPMHCKTPDTLVAECRELIEDGARELILIGQDTTSYGEDIGYEPGLAGLLRKLDAECDGAEWLRLMYVYPSVMSDEMIDAIAECERIVKYIDIPLQHINDRILKAMYRRVTRKQTETLLRKLLQRIPGVTIRSTFIVGFPGETEAEFAELLEFIRDVGFDAAGAFMYSHEPETPAARMKDQLGEAVKEERYERFMLAQQEMALAAARRRIGETFDVVVDRITEDGLAIARHAGQAPEVDSVCFLDGEGIEAGDFGPVRCMDTDDYDLIVQPEG